MTDYLKFPQSAIVGSLGEVAHILSKGTEVPIELLYGAGLTYFGSMASGRLKLSIGLESDTRLYSILLGESARVKKSTAIDRFP